MRVGVEQRKSPSLKSGNRITGITLEMDPKVGVKIGQGLIVSVILNTGLRVVL